MLELLSPLSSAELSNGLRFALRTAPKVFGATADQSDNVLSFDCTLSSLKTIVTVSFP